MGSFDGRVAVVTGAASGIGLGMAESFAAAGMKLVLSDVEEEALGKATEALRGEGADVHALVIDVSKAEQVQALADESLKRFGAGRPVSNGKPTLTFAPATGAPATLTQPSRSPLGVPRTAFSRSTELEAEPSPTPTKRV